MYEELNESELIIVNDEEKKVYAHASPTAERGGPHVDPM